MRSAQRVSTRSRSEWRSHAQPPGNPPAARARPSPGSMGPAQTNGGQTERELDYGIPRLYSPVNSRRFRLEQNNIPVGIRGKPFSPAPVDFRRKPESVLHTQELSQRGETRPRGERGAREGERNAFLMFLLLLSLILVVVCLCSNSYLFVIAHIYVCLRPRRESVVDKAPTRAPNVAYVTSMAGPRDAFMKIRPPVE